MYWGNGAACVVQNTLADFCGSVTPESTYRPTDTPTTAMAIAEPTLRPNEHPTNNRKLRSLLSYSNKHKP